MIILPPPGKKGEFARAIVSKFPEEINFRDAALLIGCSERSAAQQGHYWAKQPDVIAYVNAIAAQQNIELKKWAKPENIEEATKNPDLFVQITAQQVIDFLNHAPDEQIAGSLKTIAQAVSNRLGEAVGITPETIITYLRTTPSDTLTERIVDIANIACERVGIVGTPEQIAEAIMKNPLTKTETRLAAAKTLIQQNRQPESKEISKREQKQQDAENIAQQMDLYTPYSPTLN